MLGVDDREGTVPASADTRVSKPSASSSRTVCCAVSSIAVPWALTVGSRAVLDQRRRARAPAARRCSERRSSRLTRHHGRCGRRLSRLAPGPAASRYRASISLRQADQRPRRLRRAQGPEAQAAARSTRPARVPPAPAHRPSSTPSFCAATAPAPALPHRRGLESAAPARCQERNRRAAGEGASRSTSAMPIAVPSVSLTSTPSCASTAASQVLERHSGARRPPASPTSPSNASGSSEHGGVRSLWSFRRVTVASVGMHRHRHRTTATCAMPVRYVLVQPLLDGAGDVPDGRSRSVQRGSERRNASP